MTKGLANICKGLIVGTPFIDKLAGLVQTLEYQESVDDADEENQGPPQLRTKVIRIPVSCDITNGECEPVISGNAKADLVPDSSKKGILYFEDYGTTAVGENGANQLYKSKLRLVAWINTNWIKNNTCVDASGILKNHIIVKLKTLQLKNQAPFIKLNLVIDSIPPADKQIFSKYTYDDFQQYIMAPFEFFAIDFTISYMMNPGCIADIDVKTPEEFTADQNCTA